MSDETRDVQSDQGTPRIISEAEGRAYRRQLAAEAQQHRIQQVRDGYVPHPRAIASGTASRGRSSTSGNSGTGVGAGVALGVAGAAAGGFPSPPEPQFPYVVRGAKIYCTYGSHFRQLDMPLTHGVFIGDKPMLNDEDCKVGIHYNIAPFGICRSSDNEQQQIDIHEAEPEDLVPIDIVGDAWVVPDLPLEGAKCVPTLGTKWENAHEDVLVGNQPTLTAGCTLSCCYGGIIKFLNDGQEED